MDQAEQLRNIIKMKEKPKHAARVITVTSGKGGVGKTSLSVNLALELKKIGKRVVILDADFGLANIEVMLGIRPKYNLADVIFQNKKIKEIITEGPNGIGFISAGSGINELANLTREQIFYLTQILSELDQITDVIIIDTGAGIADSVLEFVAASSEVLLVATPEPTSITDAYALLKTLNQRAEFVKNNTTIKIVANRVKNNKEGEDVYQKIKAVVDKFLNLNVGYLGAVPDDTSVSKAIIQQKPLALAYPSAAASTAIQTLARALNDNKLYEQKERKGISQLFIKVLKFKEKVDE